MMPTKGKTSLIFVLILLFIGMTSAFGWSFYKYQAVNKEMKLLTDPDAKEQFEKEEVAKIIEKVRSHIIVPIDEEPLVATVLDAESLAKEQPFYAEATNGDRLIIYSTKAILYNLENDRLVNVGPVSLEGNVIKKIYTLDVRNGSEETGKAAELTDELVAKGYTVLETVNASNTKYSGVTLVNLKGVDLKNLEAELGVKAINELPDGEKSSNADAVIILGN